MTAMMIENGERVTAGGAGFQRHMTPIAEIDLIARYITVRVTILGDFHALHAAIAPR
jgi:hypothetical protein